MAWNQKRRGTGTWKPGGGHDKREALVGREVEEKDLLLEVAVEVLNLEVTGADADADADAAKTSGG